MSTHVIPLFISVYKLSRLSSLDSRKSTLYHSLIRLVKFCLNFNQYKQVYYPTIQTHSHALVYSF